MGQSKRMNTVALAVGILAAGVVVRGLINGSGSPSGDAIRRDEEPLAYWSVMLAGTVIAGFLFYLGLTG